MLNRVPCAGDWVVSRTISIGICYPNLTKHVNIDAIRATFTVSNCLDRLCFRINADQLTTSTASDSNNSLLIDDKAIRIAIYVDLIGASAS